jgi:hypothetical protein
VLQSEFNVTDCRDEALTTPRFILRGFLSAMNFSVTPYKIEIFIRVRVSATSQHELLQQTRIGSLGASGTCENLVAAVEKDAATGSTVLDRITDENALISVADIF